MKKQLSLLLAVMLIFSCLGCSKASEEPITESTSVDVSATTEEKASTEDVVPEDEEQPSEEPKYVQWAMFDETDPIAEIDERFTFVNEHNFNVRNIMLDGGFSDDGFACITYAGTTQVQHFHSAYNFDPIIVSEPDSNGMVCYTLTFTIKVPDLSFSIPKNSVPKDFEVSSEIWLKGFDIIDMYTGTVLPNKTLSNDDSFEISTYVDEYGNYSTEITDLYEFGGEIYNVGYNEIQTFDGNACLSINEDDYSYHTVDVIFHEAINILAPQDYDGLSFAFYPDGYSALSDEECMEEVQLSGSIEEARIMEEDEIEDCYFLTLADTIQSSQVLSSSFAAAIDDDPTVGKMDVYEQPCVDEDGNPEIDEDGNPILYTYSELPNDDPSVNAILDKRKEAINAWQEAYITEHELDSSLVNWTEEEISAFTQALPSTYKYYYPNSSLDVFLLNCSDFDLIGMHCCMIADGIFSGFIFENNSDYISCVLTVLDTNNNVIGQSGKIAPLSYITSINLDESKLSADPYATNYRLLISFFDENGEFLCSTSSFDMVY